MNYFDMYIEEQLLRCSNYITRQRIPCLRPHGDRYQFLFMSFHSFLDCFWAFVIEDTLVMSCREYILNWKFFMKFNKSPTDCLDVVPCYALSRTRVFQWHKRFSEVWEEINEDELPSWPAPARVEGKVQKIFIARKDWRVIVRMFAEIVNTNKEIVRLILHDELKMKKVSAKMIPKNLTQDENDNWKNICSDIKERLTEKPDLLINVITCDVPKTKLQGTQWKTPNR